MPKYFGLLRVISGSVCCNASCGKDVDGSIISVVVSGELFLLYLLVDYQCVELELILEGKN